MDENRKYKIGHRQRGKHSFGKQGGYLYGDDYSA